MTKYFACLLLSLFLMIFSTGCQVLGGPDSCSDIEKLESACTTSQGALVEKVTLNDVEGFKVHGRFWSNPFPESYRDSKGIVEAQVACFKFDLRLPTRQELTELRNAFETMTKDKVVVFSEKGAKEFRTVMPETADCADDFKRCKLFASSTQDKSEYSLWALHSDTGTLQKYVLLGWFDVLCTTD